MKKWTIATRLGLGVGLLGLAACSQEGAVCGLVCECEHCSDPEETLTCDSYDTFSDIADAYECDEEWSELLTCVEDNGVCDEDEANFSISRPGTCGPVQTQPGFQCTTAAECMMPDAVCQNNLCGWRTCVGSGATCTSDSDCSSSETFCDPEGERLNACIESASGRHQSLGSLYWLLGFGGGISTDQPEY